MSIATSITLARDRGMQLAELLALPVMVNLDTANQALDIGRTKGFALARTGQYPVPLKRIGNEYRVARADLFAYLGIDPKSDRAGAGTPTLLAEHAPTASPVPTREMKARTRDHGNGGSVAATA